MSYRPSKKILTNYANVMVHYALNGGKGIKKGETVCLVGNESAKPLFMAIHKEIIAAGGYVILQYLPDEFDRFHVNRELAMNGNKKQLEFFPQAYNRGLINSIQHYLVIISTADVHALEGTPPGNSTKISTAMSKFFDMRNVKTLAGKMSWSMCLYGTKGAAKEAGMSEKEYWGQIIKACFLQDKDPVAKWKQIQHESEIIRKKLDDMKIEKIHLTGPDVDLHVTIGKDRKWLGGTGRNIPSFEIFTTPDWRYTNGWMRFNQPLYYLGTRISGIYLKFKDGIIVESTATENQETLLAMLAEEDASKLGEFSLTDRRHSLITRFMGTTLYDENMGGDETEGEENGNSHVAVGRCFKEAFVGRKGKVSNDTWHNKRGFNKCTKVHVDMISTAPKTAVATLQNGSEITIYEHGQFTI